MQRFHHLSQPQERVLVGRGTEPASSGQYDQHFEEGVYVCCRCDAPLYLSTSKFISSCGWPSFDEEIADAVIHLPDPDGHRTEIVCARCKGHLGHVFLGEQWTNKNVRHCVNSVSLRFISTFTQEGYERMICAGGCFWGMEYWMKAAIGVIRVNSGYTGGTVVNPTYEEVCSGLTGHVEAIEVVFNRKVTDYSTVAKLFFEIHDPQQAGGQGPDWGSQYRSMLFFLNYKQHDIAQDLIQKLLQKGLNPVTEIRPASCFYLAEEYHQDYYHKTGKLPYCHKKVSRF